MVDLPAKKEAAETTQLLTASDVLDGSVICFVNLSTPLYHAPLLMKMNRATLFPVACCVAIILLMMVWPGDAPWGGDDVTLISTAIKANQQHRLVTGGLGGTFGYPYGPIPMQIYQVLAIFSHDPVVLVRIHAGLFGVTTALALLWLSDVLDLSPWLAPMTMLGPFFWFYGRLLWDNTFAIPVGTLLLASYGSYLRQKSGFAFYTAVSCAVALPLIHPMTLPLVMAVVAHLVLSLRVGTQTPGHFKKYWRGLIIIAVVTMGLCGAYFQRIAQQVGQASALLPPRTDALSRGEAFAFPFLAGRIFSADGFFDARGPEIGWEQNRFVVIARFISLLAYPLIWIGLLVAIRGWRKQPALSSDFYVTRASGPCESLRTHNKFFVPRSHHGPEARVTISIETAPTQPALISVCVTALLFQSVMDAALRISPYPHYYCGTWAAAVVMLWVGVAWLGRFNFIGVIYAVAICIATIAFAIDIHTHAGGSVWYGPSLSSQIRR